MKRSVLRSICTFLSCLLLVGLLAGGVVAMAEEATSGRCGQSLTWHFDPETGVLTIEGDGGMWDYDNVKQLPWFRYAGNIKEIILKKGVTSIGTNAFAGCAVEKVEFPETLQTIGKKAFYECKNLTQVDLSKTQVTTVAQKAFSKCDKLKTETVKLPETTQSVAPNAFDKNVTVTVEPPVVPPVQPPVEPPVETPVVPPMETPQEPALPYTWTETDSYGCKFVLTRQVDGSVTVIGYEKDGTEYFRSVRTYGENGKVHEEAVFTENGMSYVEDRIENEKGETVQFQRQKFDSQKKLFSKVVGERKDNVEYISEYSPDDILYYKGTTIFNEDGTSTEKSEEYGADGVTVNRTQEKLLDKDRNLIRGTYTGIYNGGATVRTGTIVSNGDGTVTETIVTKNSSANPGNPSMMKESIISNMLTGELVRSEAQYFDSEGKKIREQVKEPNRSGEGTHAFIIHEKLVSQDGKFTKETEYLLNEKRELLQSSYTTHGYGSGGEYADFVENGTVKPNGDGTVTNTYTRTYASGIRNEVTSIREKDSNKMLTSTTSYFDSKGNFVRKEVVKSNYSENGEVVSYVERFTEDDRKTGEYEKTEHLDGTVTQHEKTLDENGNVVKEFHSQRDADGKIRNVTVTDVQTGERTETTYDADGKGYTKVYDKDNNLINEYPTTLLPPGSVPSNREDGTKENTEKENPDQKPDAENKPDGKDNAENKPAGEGNTENKPAGKDNAENKPAGEGNTENKPAGKDNAENKPAGEGNTENKPDGTGNAENKPAGEGNAENKPDGEGNTENKPAGEGNTENKPDGEGNTENKPDEKGDTENKPDGEGNAENKPAGEGNTENKPAGEGNAENKPAGEGNTENKPAGEGNTENKPDGEGNAENKPAGEGNTENKPAGEGNTENKLAGEGDTENKPGEKENGVVPPIKTPNADTTDKKGSPMENPVEKPAEKPETPAEEQQKRSS